MNGGSLTLTSVTNDITVALNVQSGASLMIQNGAMLSTNAAGMGAHLSTAPHRRVSRSMAREPFGPRGIK